jgi:hypothetical protein
VYSHELADNLKIENKHIREKINKLLDEFHSRNFDRELKCSLFKALEDIYTNTRNQEQKTYKIYKDMLFLYLMDTTAQGSKRLDLIEFKMKYIDAFNYIEQEYNKSLQKYIELKESFLKMYNYMRKQNRDILIEQHKNNKNKLKVS